jgi:hypothetical protein
MTNPTPERSIGELEEEIARLTRAIEHFKARIEHAQWLTATLDRAKASHPRFQVWEWEHKNITSAEASLRVRRVLGELRARICGTWEPCTELKREIPGVPLELLYVARPPTIDEVYLLVRAAAGFTTNAQVVELFYAYKANGGDDELTQFVLSAVDR